jgi:transposase InsO family protein
VPKYNYVLTVSWPREGRPPASYSFPWTDQTETADVAAVRKAMYATLKAELVDGERYATRAAATASIGEYIERFYNAERKHSYLGYTSPVEFELRAQVAAFAA